MKLLLLWIGQIDLYQCVLTTQYKSCLGRTNRTVAVFIPSLTETLWLWKTKKTKQIAEQTLLQDRHLAAIGEFYTGFSVLSDNTVHDILGTDLLISNNIVIQSILFVISQS